MNGLESCQIYVHIIISKIPKQLELIRKSIAHNKKVTKSVIKRGDAVISLNKKAQQSKKNRDSH